ncbi:MAG: PD-(D/E)XK nuclease family protein [Desulfamplus sp.]|nr:PD-(D/E)XK nuclease family protein [Desulfamplus sp.]
MTDDTSSTKPARSNEDLVPDEIDSNIQMTVYQLAMKERYPDKKLQLRMDYLVKAKTPSYMKLNTERTMRQEEEAMQVFRRVWNQVEMMKSGVIEAVPMRSFRCAGCSYRALCSTAYLPQERSMRSSE